MLPDPAKSKTADVLFGAFYAAAIGGSGSSRSWLCVTDATTTNSGRDGWEPPVGAPPHSSMPRHSDSKSNRVERVLVDTPKHEVREGRKPKAP